MSARAAGGAGGRSAHKARSLICIYFRRLHVTSPLLAYCIINNAYTLLRKMSETRVKIIKNEEGCRDDTVPKTVETRRHCEVD